MSKGTVLLAGGSGFLGTRIAKLLSSEGYNVRILSRTPDRESPYDSFKWNTETRQVDYAAFEGVDYIVNLCGESLANERWSFKKKQELFDSRVKSTEIIYYTLKNIGHSVKAFISTSAIGYYGDTGDNWVDEKHLAGFDFLSSLCKHWEHAAGKYNELGIRVTVLRIGMVLANDGGALPKLLRPIKLYMGSPISDGSQYMSWVHVDDAAAAFAKVLTDDSFKGAYNISAPLPVSNKDFVKTAAKLLDRPLWLPGLPKSILEMFVGEGAVVLTNSCRSSSEKLCSKGFKFKFKDIDSALQDLMPRV